MKQSILLLLFFCFVCQSYSQKYVKVWSDEFNTPGLPDSTKWDFLNQAGYNGELQYYTARKSKNAWIEDTALIIEVRKENYQTAKYTSAMLVSKFKGDWCYGKFEIRAKVPGGSGSWPAIWMMPTYDEYGPWPNSGEVDIMEYIGVEPDNLHFTTHYQGITGTHSSSGTLTAISQPYNKYITFTLVWSPTKLEWYADDKLCHSYTKTADNPKIWPYNKMFYMILNLAYGGWGGLNDDTKLPHKFFVDYVRVYQLQESAGSSSLTVEPATGGTIEILPKMDKYPEGSMVTATALASEGYEFDKWLHVGSANPITIEVSKNTTLTPVFKKKIGLILNGDFSLGTKNWGNWYFENTTLKATGTIVDGVYKINITKPGTSFWSIVDQQGNIPLEQEATYLISFDAKADNPGTMEVALAKNSGDYGTYFSTTKNITNTMQTFTWTVKMTQPSDPNCRFYLGIGFFTGNVYFDNISIQKLVPLFSPIGPLCLNSIAPVLPLSSSDIEPIKGTWNPSTIATNKVGLTTYTFKPDVGQPQTIASMIIQTIGQITPVFSAIGPICQNNTEPVLPTTSINGITGTWNPSTVPTGSLGTTTYTFTPGSDQCATIATLNIEISNSILPIFTPLEPLCLNSTAPLLPLTSENGISGTWSPATVSTNAIGITTYTFSPDAGQCGEQVTMDITINNPVDPLFTEIGSFCKNNTQTALITTSNNGISGTWNPANIQTNTIGASTYTFTPNPGQCANSTTMEIFIDPSITPLFTQIGPLCIKSPAPVLPLTSTNGITGTWKPATVPTGVIGTYIFKFTPDAGQCSDPATMYITVDPLIIPAFTLIKSYCQNSSESILPTVSTDGITGSWNPSTVSTSTIGTLKYTFTSDPGQCAANFAIYIEITKPIVPLFKAIGPLLLDSVAPNLPLTSFNSISGTWSPSSISTSAIGTTTYTFMPTIGQCASSATMEIEIEQYVSSSIELNAASTNEVFEVTPNPAYDYLDVTNQSTMTLQPTVDLYDLQGQLITNLLKDKQMSSGQQIRINLNNFNLGNGIYLVNISTPEKSVTRKLVIKRP